MGLSIKNKEVELLVEEISKLTHESKTETIKKSLEERKAKLLLKGVKQDKKVRVQNFLEKRIWAKLKTMKILPPLSKEEEEKLLGY